MQKKDLETKLAASDAKLAASDARAKEFEAQVNILNQEIEGLKDELKRFSHVELDEHDKRILVILAAEIQLTASQIQHFVEISDIQLDYRLNRLTSEGYIGAPSPYEPDPSYYLLPKGTEFLAKNNLA